MTQREANLLCVRIDEKRERIDKLFSSHFNGQELTLQQLWHTRDHLITIMDELKSDVRNFIKGVTKC